MMTPLPDAELAELLTAVGMMCPTCTEEWEQRVRSRLDDEVYAEYLEYRMVFAKFPGPGGTSAFFEFIGSHPELTLLMQEARLTYHFTVLPLVAQAVGRGPHRTILDLGCNGGLTTLYLARRFPASCVVGVDRCAALVDRARELRERAEVPNAEFLHGDYTRDCLGGPFDAVVSLHTMPTYFLTFIPAERPESPRRGANLAGAAADPVQPSRRVSWALAAVKRLAGENGRVVMQERLIELSRVLLFGLFASKAGLRVQEVAPVSWLETTAAGLQSSVLIVADAQAGPVAFEEDALIDLCQPRPAREALPAPPPPGSHNTLQITGPLARHYFDSLPGPRRNVCIKATLADGRRRHLHLGHAGRLVYSYACDTCDGRELKVADAPLARQLLGDTVEWIAGCLRSGEVVTTDPSLAALPALFRTLLTEPPTPGGVAPGPLQHGTTG